MGLTRVWEEFCFCIYQQISTYIFPRVSHELHSSFKYCTVNFAKHVLVFMTLYDSQPIILPLLAYLSVRPSPLNYLETPCNQFETLYRFYSRSENIGRAGRWCWIVRPNISDDSRARADCDCSRYGMGLIFLFIIFCCCLFIVSCLYRFFLPVSWRQLNIDWTVFNPQNAQIRLGKYLSVSSSVCASVLPHNHR